MIIHFRHLLRENIRRRLYKHTMYILSKIVNRCFIFLELLSAHTLDGANVASTSEVRTAAMFI
jgi:hypothetical protein